jgi:multiple antibiotic resistance protein
MHNWSDYMQFVTALFVILNPFGAVPIFLSMTSSQSIRRRNQTGLTVACTVGVLICGSILVGEYALRLFGINLASFEVGGGILVLLMAVSMLNARQGRTRHSPEEMREAEDTTTIGVVPLGTPLVAGPGTVSTAIIFANKSETWLQTCMLLLISCFVALCVWLILRMAEYIGIMLGRRGINILTRLMGLILAALAVKFITDGLTILLPGLGKQF